MTASFPRFFLVALLLPAFLLAGLDREAQAVTGDEPGPQDEEPGLYVRGEGWQETLLAARARYLARQDGAEIRLGPWYATAPLKAKSFSVPCFPEEGVDLDARDGEDKPYWRERTEWVDGKVHALPQKNHAATYLHRTITVKEAVTVTASFGSDDGLEVWLDGEKLISKDVPRGPAADQDLVDLKLEPGAHRLLFKVYNITGNHGFYFSLRRDPLLDLWQQVARDFPLEAGWFKTDLPSGRHLDWFREEEGAAVSRDLVGGLLEALKINEGPLRSDYDRLCLEEAATDDDRWLDTYLALCAIRTGLSDLKVLNLAALQRAVKDLSRRFPGTYPAEHLERLGVIEKDLPRLEAALLKGDPSLTAETLKTIEAVLSFRREALLANPLLDFDRLLLVKRPASSPKLGLPQNWQGNCSLPRQGYEDEIAVLSPMGPTGEVATLFKPDTPSMVADVDLHFDADRMLFSMLGSHDRWQIFEIQGDGSGLRQITPEEHPDVDNYDACYLPDGRILFDSTNCFQGIPCVGGADAVANLCIMDSDGGNIRRLCFDQDHDWCPTVLNNGRVLYTRWEYSDTPHYFSRLLFHMNPDGTGQMEYYGSNSFWPNSLFYARPIPDHPTRFIAIVSGHHGVPRMGELILFDPARGRYEADGVVQRIPGYGEKVEPIIVDQLVNPSWPKFLHPYPLSDSYFLAACQPTAHHNWGIYLVDLFDNLLCIAEEKGFALLEPIPFQKKVKPPVIPDKVRPGEREATVYLADVYRGEGLRGVPRGTVKQLRVYEFHYCYNRMGGHIHVGIEGPWDVHRILGTVPVYEDGSASFRVPANAPLAVQPLDGEGKALQVMRSWFTAMPGETLSCVGCHESQNTVPPVQRTLAARRHPSEITPWYGPPRGFSFTREVQPVLDRHCVGCHDGQPRPGGGMVPDLTAKAEQGWNRFTPSYIALHPYVRRPGPESDYHLQNPLEYHVDTSELMQMLQKGHHGVELDRESWDRLVTWIDLNVPDHGTWAEHSPIPDDLHKRRMEMMARYADRPEDPEAIPHIPRELAPFVMPEAPARPGPLDDEAEGWPFDRAAAKSKQAKVPLPATLEVDLGDQGSMSFVLVPAGAFLMGDPDGCLDEAPRHKAVIDAPFYLGRFEVTRAQYSLFDPLHHNGYLDQRHKDHTTPGYPANHGEHPAIRITWKEAMAFCQWMSERTGRTCTLPTEAQWEWACRAGVDTPFFFGDVDTDFSPYANLADRSIKLLAVTGVNPQPIANPNPYQDFLPKEDRFDDGKKLMAPAGHYQPNPWGLHDMHGNVWEWTLSAYRPYPYRPGDGRNDLSSDAMRVVRGGSWRDRPLRARSGYRLAYRSYQPVHDVGFRVVIVPENQKVAER